MKGVVTLLLLVVPLVAAEPKFEVASVRPSQPGTLRENIGFSPTALNMHNVTLLTCMAWAWDIEYAQVENRPDWFSDLRFDIEARTDAPVTEDQLRLMLRALLAERFALSVRSEQKLLDVFLLTVAKNGPKFHDATAGDHSEFRESKLEGPPDFHEEETSAFAEQASIAEFASKISGPLKRPVLDRTGLTGRYDIRIDFLPYINRGEVDATSIFFGGFEDELGLKLETGKGTAEVLVIETVNKKPSEN